jgi:hypothetical protein
MRDVLEYLRSFWNNLMARVTGGALASVLTLWVGVSRSAPPPAIIFAFLTLYFVIVPYNIWHKERQRAVKAEGGERNAETAAHVEKMMDSLDPSALSRFEFRVTSMA